MIQELPLNGFNARYLHIANPNKPTLIFIPGAVQQIENAALFHKHLSPAYNYYFIELPGTGFANVLPAHYRFAFIADCLNQFIDAKIKEPVHIAALSYGTATALEFAQHYPEKLKRMVLLASAPELLQVHWSIKLKILSECTSYSPQFTDTFVGFFVNANANGIIPRQKAIARGLAQRAAQYTDEQRWSLVYNTTRLLTHHMEGFHRITAPVLCVNGEFDTYTTPELGQKLAKLLPQGEFMMMPNADHLLQLEQPIAVIDAIVSYLGE